MGYGVRRWGKKPVDTLIICLLPAFPKSLAKSMGIFITPPPPHPATVSSNP